MSENNEKFQFIQGICETYGAIKCKKAHEIYKETYGETNKREGVKGYGRD